jgi:hypothetical protein
VLRHRIGHVEELPAAADREFPDAGEREVIRLVLVVQFVDERLVDVPIVQAMVLLETFREGVGENPGEEAGSTRVEGALLDLYLERIVLVAAPLAGCRTRCR